MLKGGSDRALGRGSDGRTGQWKVKRGNTSSLTRLSAKETDLEHIHFVLNQMMRSNSLVFTRSWTGPHFYWKRPRRELVRHLRRTRLLLKIGWAGGPRQNSGGAS